LRGLVILRAFLSGLAPASSSTGDNDRGFSFILGKTKHNYNTDLCTERSLNGGSGAVGAGTMKASTFNHFIALSMGSGSDPERS